ncbi:Type II transport protein GspH [Palleronia marisminoris]|uniref:Type II secretion system protein H n=1 Tax=Palleronia marisminoris TaxID=315423 RepID=A0A1Y5TBS7_9RHOB|nr:GspH/FimT family pseudopilin [Palleronia marisminoris]SFH20223.1 Type II transport protein GspH [Palleronia marisminoris]SLN56839.1 hypothetical protein PAM7066_02712 [Palleronia marisminoris]
MKTSPPRNDGSGEAGFTLVEMLVTLTILAVIAGLAAGALGRRDPTPAPRLVAEQLQAIILEARSDALRTGRDTSVAIDLQARTFAYPPGATPLRLPPGMSFKGSLARPATGGSTAALVFRADGSSSGAELELSSEGSSARLEVSWLTGLPRVISARAP